MRALIWKLFWRIVHEIIIQKGENTGRYTADGSEHKLGNWIARYLDSITEVPGCFVVYRPGNSSWDWINLHIEFMFEPKRHIKFHGLSFPLLAYSIRGTKMWKICRAIQMEPIYTVKCLIAGVDPWKFIFELDEYEYEWHITYGNKPPKGEIDNAKKWAFKMLKGGDA